jgi:hypothetical protein
MLGLVLLNPYGNLKAMRSDSKGFYPMVLLMCSFLVPLLPHCSVIFTLLLPIFLYYLLSCSLSFLFCGICYLAPILFCSVLLRWFLNVSLAASVKFLHVGICISFIWLSRDESAIHFSIVPYCLWVSMRGDMR